MLSKKYAPQKLSDLIGKNAELVLNWYNNWKPGSPALFMWGSPGSGKTSTAHALAKEKGLDVIEVNASDKRNANSLEQMIIPATKQHSLFKRGKLIIIDEVDGIAGNEDRGGIGSVVKIIKESKFPIILTSNDAWDPKLRPLREVVQMIEYKKLAPTFIAKLLERICQAEGIKYEPMALRLIGTYVDGDVRSAINDLQTLASKGEIKESDVKELGFRERDKNIFDVLKVIFKTSDLKTALSLIRDSSKDPDELFWWIEQNIINEYEKMDEIADAYDMLSKSDIFSRKAFSSRNFSMKSYAVDMMAGVAVAKKERYNKFTAYRPPQRLIQMGATKLERGAGKEAMQKITPKLHISKKKFKSEMLPFIKMFSTELKMKEEFNLEDDQVKAIWH